MNKVILLGRLTKDCNTKYTQTGKCVTTFTLAVNGINGYIDRSFYSCFWIFWRKKVKKND